MPTYFNEITQTWFCKFYYRDYTGTLRQKKKSGFKYQREAKEWERSFINRHEGRLDMKFSDLYLFYMDSMKYRLRKTTLYTKEHLIRTKLLPYFGELPMNQIDTGTIRRWQDEMYGLRMKNGNAYTETYLKAMNNQLSAIFNYAVRYLGLPANPCLKAGSIGKKQAGEKQFWKPEEFHLFLSYFQSTGDAYLIFSILYYTGMRVGEVLALSPADFHWDTNTVFIQKSYCRLQKQDYITPPKTPKSQRIIALPQFLSGQIQNYLHDHPGISSQQRIFAGISRYYIAKYMKEACACTGVKKIRIHDLRHSHASLLIELGITPVLIAERLGHENIETTLNTYSHLYPHRQTELTKNLDSLYQNSITACQSSMKK